MKYLVILGVLLGSATSVTIATTSASAQSISNPKCVAGLRKTQQRKGRQAFAMTPGGGHCGWTHASSSTQAKANRAALSYCKSVAKGAPCRVVWPR